MLNDLISFINYVKTNIRFTMATTPPPKSIEEINTENKTEEPENTKSN